MKDTAYRLLSKSIGFFKKPSGPGLSSKIISEYNAARNKPNASHICHAPFSNMYFNVHGECAPCWLSFINPDSYPEKSIKEIWFGENFQTLRDKLDDYDLTHKCNLCLKNLQRGNYTSVLSRAYDINKVKDYPTMMELEIGNTCNLECVMCIGELSSSIRKNRDNLPPLKNPYDEKFAEQLEEFIPHLNEIRFNGGEPFLIPLVYSIFEKIERLNPNVKIVIATNGTILNNKVKSWLEKLNIHINISIDSLTDDIYETIRVNGKLKRVMENLEYFLNYTKTRNRTLCVMVNPMRNNWHEMPEFIKFTNKHDVNIWFNTIDRPEDWAIWSLPVDKLEEIYNSLSQVKFEESYSKTSKNRYNIGLFNNLVEVQIKNWLKEAKEKSKVLSKSYSDDINSAEAMVKEKLSKFLQDSYDDKERELMNSKQKECFEKLSEIDKKIKERNAGKLDFYEKTADVPSYVLYTKLESKSVNALVEDFENWFIHNESPA